jgi:hypothetical protein
MALDNLTFCLSLFNQYNFAEAKANIQHIEYYFNTNPLTMANPLIGELVNAIKSYEFDAIGAPLFQSILIKTGKTPAESEKIMSEVIKWKNYTKEQMQPARKFLQDVCASMIVKKAQKLYEESPSEYLKYLKNVNYQSSDINVFSSTNFNDVDINTVIADSATDFVPSRYDWINKSFNPHPGYEKSQMVIMVGCPGTGKSLWMMSEALYMASCGHKTLYLALGDLTLRDFIVRMGAMASGYTFSDSYRSLNQIYTGLKTMLNGNLELSLNPAGKVSADDIVDFVKARPELEVVVVDYDSNIKGASDGDNMYNSFGAIYEKLYEIASLGKLLFVGSQPKISAWGNSVIEMQDVGESARKQHTADIIIGLGREVDCPNHLHTFKISKSRRGEEGVKDYTIRLNNGRFISIPKGLYDNLKQERDKKEYTEAEIRVMINQFTSSVNTIVNNSTKVTAPINPFAKI